MSRIKEVHWWTSEIEYTFSLLLLLLNSMSWNRYSYSTIMLFSQSLNPILTKKLNKPNI